MPVEIERKFLVADDGWRSSVVSAEHFRDGLISQGVAGKVRVRLGDRRAWITVKGSRRGLTRHEFEYEVPTADAAEMLEHFCQDGIVEKVRHCVPHAGRMWSVDTHLGVLEGLTLAEVELEREDQALALPPWVGREVTLDPAFSKQALLKAAHAMRSGQAASQPPLDRAGERARHSAPWIA